MIQDIFNDYAKFPQVHAIALGGSRALKRNDEYSDYDVYVYSTKALTVEERRLVLEPYCSSMALDNRYREHEDVCIIEGEGTELNIVYRNLDAFLLGLEQVAIGHQPQNARTTGFWHNLMTGRIAYDKGGLLAAAKERYDIPYPQPLKENIISYHMNLIKYGMPSFVTRINRAMWRGDMVDITQWTGRFLDSYFDVLFALNEKLHPGESRQVQVCLEECRLLPDNFELNLKVLCQNMCRGPAAISIVNAIVTELEKTVGEAIG